MPALSFLYGAFLWGAALVAVPLVLHLVMRRQPRHLEFPALRFIRQRATANRRQLKLRHLLLLLLRCGLIVLLATALARPSLQGTGLLGDQEAPVAAALVFDTAPRMDYRQQNQSRLETAQETALWLLGQLPGESEVAVLDGRSASSVFAVDQGAARQRVERLTTTAVSLPLAVTFEDALRLVGESDKPRKEIYVFTDLARSSWSSQATQSLRKKLAAATNVGLYVIDVGVREPQNAGFGHIDLSGEVLSKNVPLRIEGDLVHQGPAAEKVVELYLVDSAGKASKRSQQTLELPAAGSARIEFRLQGLEPGIHRGYLKLAGQDALAADDVHYFTLEVTPAWRVLLVAPPKADDYALFLREALAPHALRIKDTAAFRCDVVTIADLERQRLSEYAAVCLLDPTPLVAEGWRQLGDYASGGGGVAIFLGRNAQPLDSYNTPAAQQLMPAKLVRHWRAGDRGVYLAPESLEHPLLAHFRPLQSSIPWDAFPIFTHWQLGRLDPGAAVVIPYSNTLPALIEKPVGRGKVLTLTTPISDPASRPDAWNLLPTGEEPWPFVMLANEALYYLVGNSQSKLNYVAGETAIIRLPVEQGHALFWLVPPDGDSIRQAVDERQNAVVVTATDRAGNYGLKAGGGSDQVELGFSVNLPSDAGRLDRASAEDLAQVFADAPYRVARDRDEIVRDVNLGRVGRELYPYLILALVLFLAAEQVLANRFYRPPDKPDRSAATLRASFGNAAAAGSPVASAPSARETESRESAAPSARESDAIGAP